MISDKLKTTAGFFLTDIKNSLSGLRGYYRKGVERADRQN